MPLIRTSLWSATFLFGLVAFGLSCGGGGGAAKPTQTGSSFSIYVESGGDLLNLAPGQQLRLRAENVSIVADLLWSITPNGGFYLNGVRPNSPFQDFRASGLPGSYTLTLTDTGKSLSASLQVTVKAGRFGQNPGRMLVWRYDPGSVWSRPSGTPAVLLRDGQSILLSGSPDLSSAPTAEIYDTSAALELGLSAPTTGAFGRTQTNAASLLLKDGRVLICGGTELRTLSPTAAACLYEPLTQTFKALPDMAQPRQGMTATLLPDGRVLVAGGISLRSGDALASTEIFDPSSASWQPGPTMGTPRAYHAAVRLNDGRVFLAGGSSYTSVDWGGRSTVLSSTEFCDALAGTCQPGPFMAARRDTPCAALLLDGRVLVTAGADYLAPTMAWTSIQSTEILNPSGNGGAGAFLRSSDLSRGHAGGSAILRQNGMVVVVGGWGGLYPLQEANKNLDVFDPSTGTWTTLGSFPQPFGFVGLNPVYLPGSASRPETLWCGSGSEIRRWYF